MTQLIYKRKPVWLKRKLPSGIEFIQTRNIVRKNRLNTVCEEARCPNIGECWKRMTATVMILGDVCTRNCSFCAVKTGVPEPVDVDEPKRVALLVHEMKLKHVVITSVTRDDLPDGGASLWHNTILLIKKLDPKPSIETLIPDFSGRYEDLEYVLKADPDILNHNLETVERLQPTIRHHADYVRSLDILKFAKNKGFITKTGLMLGLGEKYSDIKKTIQDIADCKVDILTLGQYLQPTNNHRPVDRWVSPDEFSSWEEIGYELGIKRVLAGPLVRSSFMADNTAKEHICTKR